MTESLPAASSWSPNRREAVVNAAAGVTLRALPHIPHAAKRVLLGGRTVTIDGNTLDTTLALMLAGQKLTGIEGLVNADDVAAARGQLEVLAASFKQSIPVAAVSNIMIAGPAGPIRARHYRPIEGQGPLLVFFHGGGQVIGSIDTHDDLCREICRRGGMHVLSVDYRLAPEHPAPAGTEDAYAAFRWAHDHATELGADPDRIAVGGDSAGGNQATLVAHRARAEGPLPAAQLLLYPVTDYSAETRSQALFANGYFLTRDDLGWFRDKYLSGGVAADDPQVSPLLADDLSGLPPALIITAGFDPLRDEGRQYADAMRAAGVPVDHREFGPLIHGFANFFPFGGDSTTAVAEVISALRAHLARD
ncbi:alpha/beta hydrolase [Mycolicibacterium celeriflavum]|uniref:Lipase n=1 Tax=Mycolicibacterium celeriflavum TaxID=1249101 RepID=A0A1X0C2D8_MYCCF|nr:alpha/beta hydrolase [Mycolicibacterium celeriflavum]MCV7239629.1 alpha/beta hydrolase [Mycolicibacterium celeriflavum]ORA51556.1 lipase [Mycolicibacterium celeriflavum]BBY43321.1 lipase [Mycolicibacterium celeriflavum]